MLAIASYLLALNNQRGAAHAERSALEMQRKTDVDTGFISSISPVEEYYLHPDSDRVYAWAEA